MRATERGRHAPAPVTCSDRQGTCFRKIWGLGIQLYGKDMGKGECNSAWKGMLRDFVSIFTQPNCKLMRSSKAARPSSMCARPFPFPAP